MSKKVLIATYSWSGTTQRVADELAKLLVDADQFKIDVPKGTFPTDMFQANDVAENQIKQGNFPALFQKIPAVDQYDAILVGSPVWSGHPATPIYTFLQVIKGFKGIVAPFYTDAGTAGDFEKAFQSWGQGLNIKAGHEGGSQLDAWLTTLGLK